MPTSCELQAPAEQHLRRGGQQREDLHPLLPLSRPQRPTAERGLLSVVDPDPADPQLYAESGIVNFGYGSDKLQFSVAKVA